MLQSLEYKFKKYDLVVCGEMGYVGFDKEGAEVPVHKSGGIMKDRVL